MPRTLGLTFYHGFPTSNFLKPFRLKDGSIFTKEYEQDSFRLYKKTIQYGKRLYTTQSVTSRLDKPQTDLSKRVDDMDSSRQARYYTNLSEAPHIPKDHYVGLWRSKVKRLRRKRTHQDDTLNRKTTLQGSQKVVGMAITSNLLMFGGKLYGALASGSASMFAEALHSLADMLNECLLMWGIWRSLRRPDDDHPYGFITEKYAWALVSGCGIFFLGGGVSLYHGITGLMAGGQMLGDLTPAFYALTGSLCFELVTMTVAYRHLSKSAAQSGCGFWEYLSSGADPTSVQVFMEDCAAVTGVVIAGTSMFCSKYFGLPFLDSVGSITIGLLLSSVAIFLIRRNIASLTEAALDPVRENQIVEILENDPIVK